MPWRWQLFLPPHRIFHSDIEILRNKINNPKLDVGVIDGANHSYKNKEHEVINQVIEFIESVK
jgi:alpha/beta superfamily hydrolase